MLKKIFNLLPVLIFSILPLFADDEPIRAKEVVISATRTVMEVLDAPGHVTIISKEDIQDMNAKNIADVLHSQAGIKINNYGGEGAQKTLSMRGSASAQVLVLLNGVRLNDSRQGGANLINIPIDNIEKIEIVRGGTSALYGSDAVGGVINIITKKEADNKLRVKVENGSYIPQKSVKVLEGPVEEEIDAQAKDLFDTQKVSVQYSRKVKNIDVVTSGSFTRANNEYIWNDDEFIDDQRRRVNTDFIGGDLYSGVSIPFETGGLDVTGVFAYNDAGAPGSIDPDPLNYYFSTDADQQNTSLTGNIHYYTPIFFSDFLSFDSKLFYKYSKLEFQNPTSIQNPTSSIESSHTLHTVGFDFVQEVSSFDLLSLIYGGNILYDTVESTEISTKERVSGGIFVEVPLYFFPLLTFTPVVRYDLYSDFPNSLNFKLSGVYNLSDDTSIKASVSKSYRAPTFNDLFWPNDGFSEGNPDLDPETGYAAEVGISMMKERFEVDGFAFTRYVIDGIDWADTGPFWQPSNVGKAIYPGAEINGNFHFLHNFSFALNYSFIYSFILEGSTVDYDLSDDKRVRNVPVHQMGAAIEYRDKRNTGRLEAEYMGKRYTDEENTDEVDSFVVLNAHYQRKLSDHFTMFVSGENILNTVYEVMDGYVMPSLFIRTGLEASF